MATAKTSTTRKSTSAPSKALAPEAAVAVQDDAAVNDLKEKVAQLEERVSELQAQLATALEALNNSAQSRQASPSVDNSDAVSKDLLRRTLERMGIRQHVISDLGLK